MAPGGEGLGWGVGVGGSDREVGQDLLDYRGLVNEGDDPHGAATSGAHQGIGLVNPSDELRPPVLGGLPDGGRWDLDECVLPRGITKLFQNQRPPPRFPARTFGVRWAQTHSASTLTVYPRDSPDASN